MQVFLFAASKHLHSCYGLLDKTLYLYLEFRAYINLEYCKQKFCGSVICKFKQICWRYILLATSFYSFIKFLLSVAMYFKWLLFLLHGVTSPPRGIEAATVVAFTGWVTVVTVGPLLPTLRVLPGLAFWEWLIWCIWSRCGLMLVLTVFLSAASKHLWLYFL